MHPISVHPYGVFEAVGVLQMASRGQHVGSVLSSYNVVVWTYLPAQVIYYAFNESEDIMLKNAKISDLGSL